MESYDDEPSLLLFFFADGARPPFPVVKASPTRCHVFEVKEEARVVHGLERWDVMSCHVS